MENRNGVTYPEKDEKSIPQDMKDLLESVNGILNVLGNRAFSDNGGSEVSTDPKVEDIKNYANNLGVAVPAGFILIHNDFQKIIDLINGNLNNEKKSSAGGIGDVVLKGIGVVSAVSMAIENLATSAKFAGTTLEVTLPDSFKTLLAEMGLVSYFHEAGYEIDLDTEGNITGIARKSKDQILEYVDATKDVMETVQDFYTVTHSGLATKIAGIATAVADGIEDLLISYKFAETMVTTELPESFATLLAEMGMISYFDEAGFIVDLNPDGTVKNIERKEASTVDTAVALFDKAMEAAKDITGAVVTSGFTFALKAMVKSFGSAIETIGTSMKFVATVKEAKIPDNFATLLAETQLIDYMEEAGYSIELDENGEVTKLEFVGDSNKSWWEKLGDGFSDAVSFVGGLAGNLLGGITDAFANSSIKEDLGKKINDKLIEKYAGVFAQITDVGIDTKTLQSDYTKSITAYFDGIKKYAEDKKNSYGRDLIYQLNGMVAAATKEAILHGNTDSSDTQSIVATYNDTKLINKIDNLIAKVGGIFQSVDTIKDKNMSVTVNVPPTTSNTNISDNDTP